MFDGVSPHVEAHFVGIHEVPVWLSRVRPHLAKMAEGSHGRYLPQDIEACVAEGKILLWLMLRGPEVMAVVATEVKQFPRLREMRFVGLVGNDPRKWLHHLASIERAAFVHFGCTKMGALALPRFMTLLPGYVVSHYLSEKDLP